MSLEHTREMDLAAVVQLHIQGRIPEAEAGYRALIAQGISVAAVYSNLAAICLSTGKIDEGISLLQQAIRREPGLSDAHHNLAVIFQQLGRLDESITAFKQVVLLAPQSAKAHYNLGLALAIRGGVNLGDAIAAFRRTIELEPTHHLGHFNLGVALRNQDDLEGAITAFRHAVLIRPDDPQGHHHLGMALHSRGMSDDAIAPLRRALQLRPDDYQIHFNLGSVLADRGESDDALASLRRAIQLKPDDAVLYAGLARMLRTQGRLDEALTACQRALEIDPAQSEPHAVRGLIFHDRNRFEEAIAAFRQALDLAPKSYRVLSDLGVTYANQGRVEEAITAFQRAIEINPEDPTAHSNLIYTVSTRQSFPPAEILRISRRFETATCGRQPSAGLKNRKIDTRQKLRIGFISAEIGNHAVSYFVESYLNHYNRERIALTLYGTVARPEPRALALMNLADTAVDLSSLSDADARALILHDDIDILIDTTSHMAGSRLRMLAQRCAPIQCHYIGFNGSTGVKAIDYFIGDDEVTPPEFSSHYSEKIMRLSRLWMAYSPPAGAPTPEQLSPPYEITLGCFNNLAKAGPETLRIWADVLNAVPTARLLLKDRMCADPYSQDRIVTFLRATGISATRINFVDRVPSWDEHMKLYNRVDIALDTLPLNSGTTGFDALFMATPLVAFRGNWMGARMSSAMLKALGRPEWIANDSAEYTKIVLEMASDRTRLKDHKRTLRAEVLNSLLCDGKSLAAALETAFIQMIEEHNAK